MAVSAALQAVAVQEVVDHAPSVDASVYEGVWWAQDELWDAAEVEWVVRAAHWAMSQSPVQEVVPEVVKVQQADVWMVATLAERQEAELALHASHPS